MNTARIALVLLALLWLPSCLVTGGSKHESSGTFVSEETLAEIEAGESEAFVLDLLGTPSRRVEKAEEGVSLLAWDWERRTSEKGAVLLIFAGANEDTRRTTTWVRIEGGIVTRVWQDSDNE
jgi:hypothetical protein